MTACLRGCGLPALRPDSLSQCPDPNGLLGAADGEQGGAGSSLSGAGVGLSFPRPEALGHKAHAGLFCLRGACGWGSQSAVIATATQPCFLWGPPAPSTPSSIFCMFCIFCSWEKTPTCFSQGEAAGGQGQRAGRGVWRGSPHAGGACVLFLQPLSCPPSQELRIPALFSPCQLAPKAASLLGKPPE